MISKVLLTLTALLGQTPDAGTARTPAKQQTTKKKKVNAPSFELPSLGALPSGEGLVAPKSDATQGAVRSSPSDATYQVTQVQHARTFTRGASGLVPMGGPLEQVLIVGSPPSTEPFSTAVRVKCPQRVDAGIELVVMDGRGDTVMSATGQLTYRGTKSDETDYQVDWDATPWPRGGDFQLLVRIGGRPLGTWPMKFHLRNL